MRSLFQNIIIIIFLVSCNFQNDDISVVNPSPITIFTEIISTDANIQGKNEDNINTSTPTQQIVEQSTLFPTPFPTWTPFPELSLEQSQDMLLELLETNNDCLLPCWWGIVPGESNWWETKQFLETFGEIEQEGKINENEIIYSIRFPSPPEIFPYYFSHYYLVENNVVQKIQVIPGDIHTYSISNVIKNYGLPEIYITTQNDRWDETPWTIMAFYYADSSILFFYSIQLEVHKDFIESCFGDTKPGIMSLGSLSKKLGFYENEIIGNGQKFIDHSLLLDDISEDNSEIVYETLLKNNNVCIQINKDIWVPSFE